MTGQLLDDGLALSFPAEPIIADDLFVITEFSAFSISSTSRMSKLKVVLAFVIACFPILKYLL